MAAISNSPAAADQHGHHIGRAVFYMVLAMVLIPCLNAGAKYLTPRYSTIEITWARYAGHFVYMVLVFIPQRGWRLFRTAHLKAQILRSTLLLSSTAIYVSALRHTSLPIAASVGFVAPFIVIALSPTLLQEKVGLRRWVAATTGFAGAMLILRPGSDSVPWASFLVLGSALCNALYQLLTRRLAAHDPPETSITYIAVMGFLLTTALVPFAWHMPESIGDAALLFSLGMFGGFGHYYIVKAFQWGPASVVAPLNYLQLLGAALFGLVVFGEFPTALSWLGAAVIVGSGLYVLATERAPLVRRG